MPDLRQFLQIKNAFAESFSPDGSLLAYTSNETGIMQAYVVPVAGGDPRQLTDAPEPISFVMFSPVSVDEVIFGRDEGGNERTQLYRLCLSRNELTNLTHEPEAIFRLGGWSRDGKLLAYATNRRNGQDFDVVVRDLVTDDEQVAYAVGGWCSSLGFSPSGRYVVVSRRDSNVNNDLYLVDLSSDALPRHLTPHDGAASYGMVRWLADEGSILLISNEDTDKTTVRRLDLATGAMTQLLASRWDAESLALSWDGLHLAVSTNEDGYSRIRLYWVGKTLQPVVANLPTGELSGLFWSQDGSRLAFSRCAFDSSYNAWVWQRSRNMAAPVTIMPMGVPPDTMVEPQLFRYKSFDGLSVPAFLYLPRTKAKQLLPAIINIHGGPEGQYRPGFVALTQYWVQRGYAVIAPNVRGSAGYGKSYLALDDRHRRLDSVRDLESLHEWIKRDGRIDPSRVALMGGSYGGYMVLAGLAFQPERWAAGVDVVGIANLVTFLENTASYRRALREAEYGYLATDREFLRAASPMYRADNIRAPLLIIHGANDPRVPLSEAQQMHDNLSARGVPVKLLVYDDEGHGLSKLKNRLDAYPQVADFLDAVLRLD